MKMKWNSHNIKYENHEKKKVTKPKDKAKGSTEGGGKKLLRFTHMIHLSLIGIL